MCPESRRAPAAQTHHRARAQICQSMTWMCYWAGGTKGLFCSGVRGCIFLSFFLCTTQTAVIRCATRAHTERTHNRTRVLFLAMTVMCHYGGDVMHFLLWRGGARARSQRRPREVQFYVDFFKNCVSTIRPSLPPAAGADAQSNTRSNFINDRDRCVMVRGDANDFSARACVEEFFRSFF